MFLGEMELPGGDRSSETAGKWVSGKLLENGWPSAAKDPEAKPWYKNWWVWGVLVSGAALIAVLAGGGGGSGASADSSIAVNF